MADEATPGGETIVKRSQTVFGAQGEALGYREQTTDLLGLTTDKLTTDIIYDSLRRLLTFGETSVRRGEGRQSLPEDWDSGTVEEQNTLLAQILENLGGSIVWAKIATEDRDRIRTGEEVKIGDVARVRLDKPTGELVFSLNLEETAVRLRTDYDVLGRLAGTKDRRHMAQFLTQEIEWKAKTFDGAGRAKSDMTVTAVSPGPLGT